MRTEVVTGEELARTHARTLRDALENVPGVQLEEIHGKSGVSVSLQGLSSEQVLVLIDGLPLAPSTGSSVDVSQYLLADVERVEVVKGAASALYGSAAMGGVINVITKHTQPGLAATVEASLGSRGGQNVSGKTWDAATRDGRFTVGGGAQTWRVRASGDVLHDDGFAVNPQGWARQGDGVQRRQFTLRGDWLPQAGTNVWAEYERYREDDRQRFTSYVPPVYVPQSKTEAITRNRAAAGAVWSSTGGLRAELKGLHETYTSTSRGYSQSVLLRDRRSEQDTRQLGGQLDFPAWYGQRWQLGFDWRQEDLSQRLNGTSELARDTESRESRELFAQNEIALGERGSLVLGVRGQHDSDFGSHLAPRASLLWQLPNLPAHGQGRVRASIGNGYRVPNLKERHYVFDHSSLGYMVLGNPNLKPESSTSLQLGAEADWRTLSLSANFFDNRLRDLIQIDEARSTVVNDINVYRYGNVARARTYGVEMGARWQLAPMLTLSGDWTWMHAENRDSGKRLTRRPNHIARLGLDWMPAMNTTLTLRGRAQSSETLNAAGTRRSPGWATLDLRLTQRLGAGWSLFAGVDNVFDRQRDFTNADDYGPLAGRRVFLGVQYEYARLP